MCLYRRESLSRKTFAVCTFCKGIFFLEIGYIRVIWAEDFIFHTFNAFFQLHICLFLQNKIQPQLLLPKLPRIG